MAEKKVNLIVHDRYEGTRTVREIFAQLAVQSLQNRRGFVWTRTQNSDIMKSPTVKS